MGRPRLSENRDTRQDIIDAALDLFAEKGFNATSVRMIARAAGVTESALYHHFSGKDALLGSRMQSFSELRQQIFHELLAEIDHGSLRDILIHLATRVVETMRLPKWRKFMRIMVLSEPDLRQAGNRLPVDLAAEGIALMQKFWAALAKRGLVRDDVSIPMFAMHFFGPLALGVNSPLAPDIVGPEGHKLRVFVGAHVDILLRGVARGPNIG